MQGSENREADCKSIGVYGTLLFVPEKYRGHKQLAL